MNRLLDLSRSELDAGLWCIHIVEAAVPHEPPYGETLGSLKRKLLEQRQATLRKAPDIPGYEVSVEGRGW